MKPNHFFNAILLIPAFLLLTAFCAHAQARIEVFTSDEEPFYLTINGKKINETTATNVSSDLIGSIWTVKVEFANPQLNSIVTRVEATEPSKDLQFELIKKKGQYKMVNLQTVQETKALIKGTTSKSIGILMDEVMDF